MSNPEILDNGRIRLYHGDCRDILPTMEAGSAHCCVTSPPYYGLRDYGVDGQIGLEQTPDEYIACMVEVFAKVRRVLRDDGTLWLNLGDSYGEGTRDSKSFRRDRAMCLPRKRAGRDCAPKRGVRAIGQPMSKGRTSKQLLGVPWRVALALQADGWYLRQDIIWHKPNPMPESVRDRCTKAHEYIFLLAKLPSYYFNAKAIAEPAVTAGQCRGVSRNIRPGSTSDFAAKVYEPRNKRSVWTVPTRSFHEAHFATFPPELIEPCIRAGCPEGGTVLDPFSGAGTTGLVSIRTCRNYVGIELNSDYAAMTMNRLKPEIEAQTGNIGMFA